MSLDDTLTTGLPHYTNSTASRENYEPIYLNQYEVIITPPEPLNVSQDVIIISEQVKNVKSLPEITPLETVEQYYKFAKRTYADAKPKDTTHQFKIEFEVNLDRQLDMYVYNFFRAWADIIFNPETGSMGLKRDYVGSMNIFVTNKAREIFRKFTFNPIYIIKPFTQMELDYQSKKLYTFTVEFQADDWDEDRKGSKNISLDHKTNG